MENKNKYNILIIYINEAHPADIWNIGESAGTINDSHKKITDRIACAVKFQQEFKLDIPIYADNMENTFEEKFACWPFRFFVIEHNLMKYIGNPEDSTFNICDLFDYLQK